MKQLGVVAALWAGFTFVTWNVLFDRRVNLAAEEFTREQIVRARHGVSPISIHEGFSPRVRDAALQATLWVVPIVGAGVLTTWVSFRRVR